MPTTLNQQFIDNAIEKFSTLPAAATPQWGGLNGSTVIGHLIGSYQYPLGQIGNFGFQGNWITKNVLWHVLRLGLGSIPKNVKFKDKKGNEAPAISSEGDIQKLKEVMEANLTGLYETSDLLPHPAFGDIGAKGWARFHVLHTEHHLEQFGLKS